MSTATYKTADTVPAGGPSPIIWADCPVITILRDPSKGIHIFEDFEGGGVTDNVADYKFALVGDTPEIERVTDEVSGVVTIEGTTADNDEAYLVSNLLYELKKNNRKKFWLEARFKLLDSNAPQGVIFGLGEDSMLAADALVDNATSLGDYDFIGFAAISGSDGGAMEDFDSVYHEAGDGGAPTVIETDIVDIDGTDYDDIYIKLGIKFDGKETVSFYLNGVLQATTFDLDSFDTDDQLTEELGVVLGIKYDGTVTGDGMKVDWIRFACEK